MNFRYIFTSSRLLWELVIFGWILLAMCSVKFDIYNVLDWFSKLLSTWILLDFLLFFFCWPFNHFKKIYRSGLYFKNNDDHGKSIRIEWIIDILIITVVRNTGTCIHFYENISACWYILIPQIIGILNFGMYGGIVPLIGFARKFPFCFPLFLRWFIFLLQFDSSLCFLYRKGIKTDEQKPPPK